MTKLTGTGRATAGRLILLPIVALASYTTACTNRPRHVSANYPVSKIVVRSDGTEALALLSKGVKVASVLDLAVFDDFYPGATPVELEAKFGPPDRVERMLGESAYGYRVRENTVWVVEWVQLSKPDSSRVVRHALRVAVQDALPFFNSLPASLRQLLKNENRLASIVVQPSEPRDPVVALSVADGRVESIFLLDRTPRR